MMLADLCLQELPSDVLELLQEEIVGELRRRHVSEVLQRKARRLPKWHRFTDQRGIVRYEDMLATVAAENAAIPRGLPRKVYRHGFKERLHYLPCLLAQEWTALFVGADNTTPCFYVYAHLDPRGKPVALPGLQKTLNGKPFYIGKGSGRRAWDLKRNQGHAKRIATLRTKGHTGGALVQILAEPLTEREAFVLEAKLIYFFGSIYEEQTQGCLVNLADHARPTFTESMQWLATEKEYLRQMQHLLHPSNESPSLVAMYPSERPALWAEKPYPRD